MYAYARVPPLASVQVWEVFLFAVKFPIFGALRIYVPLHGPESDTLHVLVFVARRKDDV